MMVALSFPSTSCPTSILILQPIFCFSSSCVETIETILCVSSSSLLVLFFFPFRGLTSTEASTFLDSKRVEGIVMFDISLNMNKLRMLVAFSSIVTPLIPLMMFSSFIKKLAFNSWNSSRSFIKKMLVALLRSVKIA